MDLNQTLQMNVCNSGSSTIINHLLHIMLLMRHFHPDVPMFFPEPTWSNHHNIWGDAQVPVRMYRYYHPDSKGLNFGALMDDIKTDIDSTNVYAYISINALIVCLPPAIIKDGKHESKDILEEVSKTHNDIQW